jgi:hypothetical protein
VDADLDVSLEADVDVDLDVDVDVDADVDLDADADVDMDADADHDVDVEVASGSAPLSVNLMNLCFTWGTFGLWLNQALPPLVGGVDIAEPIVFVLTTVLSLGTTAWLNRLIGKYLPTISTFSTRPVELVGRVARSVYALKEDREGTARVEDRHGNLQQVSVFLGDGEPEVSADRPVLLTRYDEARGAYEASSVPPELAA